MMAEMVILQWAAAEWVIWVINKKKGIYSLQIIDPRYENSGDFFIDNYKILAMKRIKLSFKLLCFKRRKDQIIDNPFIIL